MRYAEAGRSGHKRFSADLKFFGVTATVAVVLVALNGVFLALVGRGPPSGAWNMGYLVLSWGSVLIPFSAYAGGAVTCHLWTMRLVVSRAMALAVISYLLLAFASPVADYQARIESQEDVRAELPVGPLTPGNLLELRARVESQPPSEYSFRIGHPLAKPPNWLTYLIHSVVVLALFSLPSALLGHHVAGLTTGLPPLTRLNARWAAGLLSGGVFYAALSAGGDWVRADPSHSAIVGAWLPLLFPLVALLGSAVLIRRRGSRLHTSDPRDGK